MTIRPIRTDDDLDAALTRIDDLWDAPVGSAERDERDVLVVLVEAYEQQHQAAPPLSPVDVIRDRLTALGMSQNELARRIGVSSGRMSDLLKGRRDLTLAHVRSLADVLGLPSDALLGDAPVDAGIWFHLEPGVAERVRWCAVISNQAVSDWIRSSLLANTHHTEASYLNDHARRKRSTTMGLHLVEAA